MSGWTKLESSLVTSTVWCEADHVRLVWITMLAICDRHGRVMASVPGLAHIAHVTIPLTEAALGVLGSPDPYSRTPDDQGRRIRKIDGGWYLVNRNRKRDDLGPDEDRQRERNRRNVAAYRKRKRDVTDITECITVTEHVSGDVTSGNHKAETEVEEEKRKGGSVSASPPPERTYEASDEDGPPVGLSALQYARGLLERCNMPHASATQQAASAAITAHAREHKIELHKATAALIELARSAIERGELVNKFWFEDGKYRGGSHGANSSNRGAAVGRVERSKNAFLDAARRSAAAADRDDAGADVGNVAGPGGAPGHGGHVPGSDGGAREGVQLGGVGAGPTAVSDSEQVFSSPERSARGAGSNG